MSAGILLQASGVLCGLAWEGVRPKTNGVMHLAARVFVDVRLIISTQSLPSLRSLP